MLPPVYAIMITNTDKRLDIAKKVGMRNFIEQTYFNKHLIVVNHGKVKLLKNQSDRYELMIEKNDLSLGDMRNLALDLVPMNSIWYVHDDDDIRPNDYVSFLVKKLLDSKATAVFIKYRIEYIMPTAFVYVHKFENGTTHVMMRKIDKFKYLDEDTLEDVMIQDHLGKFKQKYITLDNDPKLYIRLNHYDNTSPFASEIKSSIGINNPLSNYKEYEISDKDKDYAHRMVKLYLYNNK